MHLQAHRFVSSHYPPVPFFPLPAFFFLLLFHACLHLVTFLKNWQQRREIDVMKNNWDISMSHLLCRYGHPLSPQRGSRLSVVIEGILQISQQLSEVTSQMHGWPRSLPSIALLPALCPNFVSLMLGFHCPLVFIYLFILLPCSKLRYRHIWAAVFIYFGTPLIILEQLNLKRGCGESLEYLMLLMLI